MKLNSRLEVTQPRRLISGMACLYSSGAISWRSRRQTTVSLSSSEPKIVATREPLWLMQIIKDVVMEVQTVEWLIESEFALQLSKNHIKRHHQMKHMHVQRRHFFLRECLSHNDCNILAEKVSSNIADVMTKSPYKPRLLYFMQRIEIQ